MRPACLVRVEDLPAERRVRYRPGDGPHEIDAEVVPLGLLTGLTRMGVSLRSIAPGCAGTHRHYHDVEEEWVCVLSGRGEVRIGPLRIPVRAGHFVGFPPGPAPHHLWCRGEAPLVLLEGGERRPREERRHYPDLGVVVGPDGESDRPRDTGSESGEVSQVVHIDDLDPRSLRHPVDPGAARVYRSLHGATGATGATSLRRQAVRWSRVASGDRSTAYHTHATTDEWIWLLEGTARARVGDESFELGPGDFLGHPAGGPPHVMEAVTELVYLMGGQIDPDDVVDYPDAGVRRRKGKLEPL